MKKLIIILSLILAKVIPASCQQNVVILVDVSGSIPHIARNEAKTMMKDLLMGRAMSNSAFYYEKDPGSSLNLPGAPLVGNGSHILLIKFGNKETSDVQAEITLTNYPQDLNDFLDKNYPRPNEYTDKFTYLNLAKAKAAQAAKQMGINRFMLLLATDNINDFTGGNSPNYSSYEQALVDNYNTKSNTINEAGIDGRVKLRDNNDFKVPLQVMDISQYKAVPPQINSTTIPQPVIDSPIALPASIEFAGALASANRKKPAIINATTVNLTWLCKNCTGEASYDVNINQVDGGSFRAQKKSLPSPAVSQNLDNGTYKISVSAESTSGVSISGAVTYITVDTGSGAAWLWGLLLILVIGAAWYLNKQRQQKKIRESGKETSSLLDRNAGTNNNRSNEF